MINEVNIIRYKMYNILIKIILILMNRIIFNIQLYELFQNSKLQYNFDICILQFDIGKKKLKFKEKQRNKKR